MSATLSASASAAAGTLETVLDPYTVEHPPFFLYYPEQHRRLELLRLFVSFLRGARHPRP